MCETTRFLTQSQHEKIELLYEENGTGFQEGSETNQREFLLSLRLKVTENNGATSCLIIT